MSEEKMSAFRINISDITESVKNFELLLTWSQFQLQHKRSNFLRFSPSTQSESSDGIQ